MDNSLNEKELEDISNDPNVFHLWSGRILFIYDDWMISFTANQSDDVKEIQLIGYRIVAEHIPWYLR